MNIGIRLHDTAGTSLDEHLQSAVEQGFSCVHLAMQKVVPGFEMKKAAELLTPELADSVRMSMEKAGTPCVLLGCYLNLAVPDEETYRHTLEIYRAHLRFAKWMGASVVGTETGCPNAGYKTVPECWTEETLQLLIRRMKPVADYAEELGQPFAIEPVWRHIVNTPKRAKQVLDAFAGYSQFGIIFDAVNLLNAENCGNAADIVTEGLDLLGTSIRLLHLKDWVPVEGSSDVKSVACGHGSMRYDELLRFGCMHDLPMTLENTSPDNALQARMMLEEIASKL